MKRNVVIEKNDGSKTTAGVIKKEKIESTGGATMWSEKKQFRKPVYLRIIPILLSILATIILLQFVKATFSPGTIVYRLFYPAGSWYQMIVPATILFLFAYCIMDLLFKSQTVRREKYFLKRKEILSIPRSVHYDYIDGIRERFEKLGGKGRINWLHLGSFKSSRVYSRLHSLLDHLGTGSDVQRTHEFFRHQSDIESDNAISGYTTLRIFIWAMPILGFIGTVLGIGLAIGNFSGFLTGDIDNIAIVKTELSKVASGLSYAFDTTLLGLTTSLIAMLFTSFVQKGEEDLLSNLDELGLDIISNFKGETTEQRYSDPNSLLLEEIQNFRQMIADQIGAFISNVKKFGVAVNDSTGQINDTFKQLPEKISLHEQEFKSELQTLLDNFKISIENLDKSYVSMLQNVGKQSEDLSSIIQKNGEFLQENYQRLEKLNQQMNDTFREGSDGLIASAGTLSEKVESLKPAQELALEAINTLKNFTGALENMQKDQQQTNKMLQQMTGPFEFKFVPQNHNDNSKK